MKNVIIIFKNNKKILLSILIASFILLLFSLSLFNKILMYSDINIHCNIILKYLEYGTMPSYPGFYLLTFIFSGFSNEIAILFKSAVIVLSIFLVFKYICVLLMFKNLKNHRINYLDILVSLLLLFIHPILLNFNFEKNMYLGLIAQNIWHNSTVIVLYPLAILQFIYAIKVFKEYNINNLLILILTISIGLFFKPSFYFCLAPTIFLFSFYKFKISSLKFWHIQIVLISTFIIFLIQSFALKSDIVVMQTNNNVKFETIIAPFSVWKLASDNKVLISFLLSFAFPITYLLLNIKTAFRKIEINFAIFLNIFSLIIYIFLAETGERFYHGNFIWQCFISNFILFTVVMINYLNDINKSKLLNFKNITLLFFFLAHLYSGYIYIYKLFVFKNYF